MTGSSGSKTTVDVYFRTSVMGVIEARQEGVLDRAEQLVRKGVVDDLRINYWSSQVTAPDNGARNDSGCPDVVRELYDVTAGTDCSLSPCFREAKGDRDNRTVLFLPVVCLVVRHDGDIVGVYPSDNGGEHHSVENGLDIMERGEEPVTVPSNAEASS